MSASPSPADGGIAPRDFLAGRFFPNDCHDAGRWDAIGPEVPLHLRHLPTRAALAEVEARLGPSAMPLARAWRALWLGAMTAERLEAHAGADGFYWPSSPRGPAWDPIGAVRALEIRRSPAAAAEIVHAGLEPPADDRVRERVLHVLEDAATMVHLARSGTPFACQVSTGPAAEMEIYGSDGSDRFGPIPKDRRGHLRSSSALTRTRGADNPYWTLPAFRARAGRPMAVAEGPKHLAVMLLDMASQGHAKAFLKGVQSKSGTWVVDVAGIATPAEARARLKDAMGDAYSRMKASTLRGRTFLVQGFTPFLREHRFLVVSDRVVASTASDRALSVLDADRGRIVQSRLARLDRPADGAGEFDRGSAPAETDRAAAARMARLARGLAREIAAGRDADGGSGMASGKTGSAPPDCYCLDVGETADGRTLPIEINTILFCGLYAADYARVSRAMARRAARLLEPTATDPAEGDGSDAHLAGIADGPRGEAIVRRFVEAIAADPPLHAVESFARRRSGSLREWISARRPSLTPLQVARRAAYFEGWRHPDWAEAWNRDMEELGRARLGQAVATMLRRDPGGRVSAGLYLPLSPEAAIEALSAGVTPEGADGWSAQEPDLHPGPWASCIGVTAPADDVDWDGTVLANMLAGGSSLGAPVRFRPGATGRLAAVFGAPGGRPREIGALAGAVVRLDPGPA